jgi:hypothetical protein
VNIDHYRRLWSESLTQPEVACEATRPFAVPVGITAQVSGLNPEFVGRWCGTAS